MADNQASKQKEAAEELFFGKYKSKVEAEQGWANMVQEFNRIKAQASEAVAQMEATQKLNSQYEELLRSRQPAEPTQKRQVVDEEGHLDVNALLGAIDDRLAGINRRLDAVPQTVHSEVTQLMQPVIKAATAEEEFLNRPDVDPKFTKAEFDKVLRSNPTYNKVFKRLMADPQAQGEAYEAVYQLWKDSNQKGQATGQPAPRQVPEQDKLQAGMPQSSGGPPVELPGEGEMTFKEMAEKAKVAQDSVVPGLDLEFAKEWIKGSKLESAIKQDDPDWAR